MKEFGTAVILCGGKSTRMGFDKSLIKVNDRFLVEIIGERLEDIFDNIILVSNDKEKTKDLKYSGITDIIPNLGPIGAIHTALKATKSKYIFVTACDMPIINVNYIRHMMSILEEENFDGIISRNASFIEPLYAFYSVEMIKTFESEIKKKNLRLFDVLSKSNIYYVEEQIIKKYSKNMDIFTNINYKNELAQLNNIKLEEI